jgi:acyl-CoA synthetase (AMP-forming)/AMP-acid ligase II
MYSIMLKVNAALKGRRYEHVVLYASKRFPTYAAIFSIVLSNNTWVPLSPENPEARNLEILNQTNSTIVIYDEEPPGATLAYFKEKNVDMLSLDKIISSYEEEEFESNIFNKNDVAYIMFTSGSTGTPKGVPMTHENYINFVNNILTILPLDKGEVFSDFHDFTFDISVFCLFTCPFVQGAFSPIRDEKDKVIPINHIVENKITIWSSVPSVINRIKAFRPKDKIETSIKIMFLCGEPLKVDVLQYCFDNMNMNHVYNFYGLTETGVENFYHRCTREDLSRYVNYGIAPIGKPLPGNEIKVIANKELYISGCQITSGYLGGRSSEKFDVVDEVRWCKTGDIVEKYEDVYFCKGRLDSQVKISGFRVELMDIEAHIAKQENVEQVVCFVKDHNGISLLVAAVKPEGKFDFRELQTKLNKELPSYMIPKEHLLLESFPLNNNGKVDRKRICQQYRREQYSDE